MQESTFTLPSDDGVALHVYRWSPDEGVAPRAVLQVSHGLAEHAGRYKRFAEAATARGIVVYADDHRGHGRTARGDAELGVFSTERGWRKLIDDLGRVTGTGNPISGTETWHLFANPTWKARGGGDCTITWKISGYTGTPSGCGDCDLSIKVHAEPDVNGSGCVEGLKKKEARPFDEQYDVKRLADGNAFVFFHKSGKQLGQGYHDNKGTFNYLSIHQCKWF
jgi:hypothetical protein